MKELKTISEYEILRMARQRLDQKWEKAEEAGDDLRCKIIDDQIDEISRRMEEIRREVKA